jgi:DNA (cytosine-5)-methyltransferase 1
VIFGSVCSGIEAASVAWGPLGWEAAWFAEIDPFACAVLKYRWPGVVNIGDFTQQTPGCGGIDLLVGGTPCQSFSVAGRRLGLDDPRGNLALEFLRLARLLGPRWLVFENVPGFLSSGGGRDFGAFLGLLGQLGYGFAYRVLDAQYFGVPQRRRRVFVVGHLGDWRRAAAVLFERSCLSGDSPPGREAGAGVAGSLTGSLGRRNGAPGKWGEVRSNLIAHSLRADGFDASEDGTGRGTPLVPVAFNWQADGKQTSLGFDPDSGTVGTLNGSQKTAVGFIVNAAESCAKQNHAREAEVAQCIDSNGSFASAQGGTVVAYNVQAQYSEGTGPHARPDPVSKCLDSHGLNPDCQQGGTVVQPAHSTYGVRRLTPREAERLMGLPDDYTLVPYRGKLAADGPRYKALGNSFAVPVMRWIGQRIKLVEGITVKGRRARA